MARLGDICQFQSGGTPRKDNKNYFNGDIPWITTVALNGNCIGNESAIEWITTDAIQNSAAKIVPANSIMVGTRVGVGKVAINQVPMSTSQDIISLLNIGEEKWDKGFLCKFIQSRHEYLNAQARGATIKGIKIDVLAELSLPDLNYEGQKHIAAVLDKVSDLIALRKQQLAKLDELVKARFVEMFGNPVANDKGWERVHLSTCLESIDNGKSFVCKATARQGDWPAVLKLSAATYGIYRPEENKAMLDETQFIESAAVRAGDLLFTRKNTPELVGMCAYVNNTPNKLMMPDLIFRLNTKPECNKIYLWKLINHDLFRDSIEAIATGSAKSMSNISKERLLSLEIILPPYELQKQFASFVKQVDKSKLTVQQGLDKLELLKKALMQKYFK